MSGRLSQRFAQLILRCYPPAWRRRYADEMRVLLEDAPADWRRSADLAAGAVREWASPGHDAWPTMSDLERAQGAFMVNCLLIGLLVEWSARSIASGLFHFGISAPAGAERLRTFFGFFVAVRLGIICLAQWRNRRRTKLGLERRIRATLMPGEPMAWACFALIAGVLYNASPSTGIFRDWTPYAFGVMHGAMAAMNSARMVRLERLYSWAAKRHERVNSCSGATA